MRCAAFVAILSLASCEFAVKHPAITAGLVGGGVAALTCELATSSEGTGRLKNCGIITGTVGVGLALVVAGAILLGGEGHTVLVRDPDEAQTLHEFKPPEDAGVADAPPAPTDAPPAPTD
jgi:hypothetical protein